MISTTAALYALAFIMNGITGIMVVSFPLLAIRFGADPLELGVLGSLSALVYTLGCPLTGWYSDRLRREGRSRKRLLVLAASLLVLTDASIFFVGNIRDVMIIAVCGCFCPSLFWPPLQAWLAETGSGELSKRLGTFNLSWSLGITVGPMAGGFLFGFCYLSPWLFGVAGNAAILLLLLALNEGAEGAAPVAGMQEEPVGNNPVPGFLPLALWANFICWFSLANLQSMYPKLASMRGMSPQILGCLFFLVGATQTLTFFYLRRRVFWHYRYIPLAVVHLAAGFGLFMIFRAESVPLLSIAFPLMGISLGLSYYSSIYYSLRGYADKGRRTGVHEFMVGSGFLFGPITGGVLAQFVELRAPFLACSVLLAGTAAVETVLYIRSRLT